MRRFTRALTGLLVTIVVGGIVIGVCLAALLPSLGIVTSAASYTTNLVTDLRDLSERSTVYDAAGNQIGVLGLENRQNATLDEVPQVIIDAVVATEDKTFWTNEGVDLQSVVRAALKNLTSGEIEQGGSTISQQLVKNRILSPKRDLNRKIREVLLAIQLNKDYSKREILEQYLNTVYFGQGSYGIKSAVERLLIKPDPASPLGFHITGLNEVSVGEAALLAGLISSPEAYNPFLHPEKAKERRSFVISQMLEDGYITPDQAAAAELEPLPTLKPNEDLRPRDSWVEEVQDRLFNDPRYSALGATKEARQDAILRGGLKIYTTLDPNAQANALDAINTSIGDKPGFTAALVAMDPTSGAVRAMVAGTGFDNSQYNIATTTPGRQAGSTWKTITLAAAMQNRFSANDQVDGTSPCDFGPRLGATANAEAGEGVMTVRSATAGSVNCAFVRIELAVGFTKVIDMAHKLGITQDTLQPILTLTLGTIESTPLEMATVASSIASMGLRHDPYFVEKIVNPEGIAIYQEQHLGLRVLDEEAAACEVDLLRGVVTGGTGTGAQVPGWQVAGKTGTTDNRADAWFLGMTPKLVAAVWHGNPDGRVPGAGFGGQIPASIFRKFMTAQLDGIEPEGWPGPPGWCNAPGQFLTEGGRTTVPEGFEVRDGKLVPITLPPPTVQVKGPPVTTPVTRPPVTRPPVVTTRPPLTVPPTTLAK
ncbi:MAG: transglycosylase domain-containing protein [Acidimicrobiia bacterium]|jgi:penicillin-binding protein 1A